MLPRSSLLTIALTWPLIACTVQTTTHPTQPPPNPTAPAGSPAGETGPPPPPAPAADAPPAPKPIATAPPPRTKSELGSPCTEAPTAPAEVNWDARLCNRGQVVGAFSPGDMAPPLPTSAKVLTKTRDDWKVASYIATDGPTLHVRIITCANCRRITGWHFVGHPHLMTDEQRRAIQRFAGLEASVPPLASTDAWNKQAMPKLP